MNSDTFAIAASAHGLNPPAQILADGRVHRCGTTGKPRSLNGAYLLRPDGTGWVQNHETMDQPAPFGLSVTTSRVDRAAARELAETRQRQLARLSPDIGNWATGDTENWATPEDR